MRSLRHVALERVKGGETSLEEVQRVVGDVTAQFVDDHKLGDQAVGGDVTAATPTPLVEANVCSSGDTARAPKTALVVDDEATSRTFARSLLERGGYSVTEATDGLAAIEQLRARPFDLMVLDLDMPGLAGYEVLTHTRRQGSTATLPVIVLTGTERPDAEVEVIEHGADDYLRKPINARRFMARVAGIMRRAAG
jgi:CheY-like chemotaxis protein